MSKPTSAVKRKYNKSAYHRYEFSVKVDAKLDYFLEQYKSNPENSLSALVRDLLCKHFNVNEDELYVPFHLEARNGKTFKVSNYDFSHTSKRTPACGCGSVNEEKKTGR